MSSQITRSDRVQDITYPSTSDAKGSTRLNYMRRPYYFGPFSSPHSYVMFGLWKHMLLRDGEPPQAKDIRPIVDEFLGVTTEDEPLTRTWSIPDFRTIAAVSLLLACVTMGFFLSIPQPGIVDGKVLTEAESELVRGFRSFESNRIAKESELPNRFDRAQRKITEDIANVDSKGNLK